MSAMSGTQPLRVLLVEDSPAIARMIHRALESPQAAGGFQVSRSRSLAEARREGDAGYDVVLLDLNLPDSAGLRTFHRMRSLLPGVPIVILSGEDEQRLSLPALRQGAQDFLPKEQLSSQGLVRALRHAVARHRCLLA